MLRIYNMEERKAVSLKYQVLDKSTALIGVLKLKDKQTGEMTQSYISFAPKPEPQPVY